MIDDDFEPNNDWEFLKNHHLKPTNLLRKKIKELRETENGTPNSEMLLDNISRLQKQLQKIISFLEIKGLLDEYLKQ